MDRIFIVQAQRTIIPCVQIRQCDIQGRIRSRNCLTFPIRSDCRIQPERYRNAVRSRIRDCGQHFPARRAFNFADNGNRRIGRREEVCFIVNIICRYLLADDNIGNIVIALYGTCGKRCKDLLIEHCNRLPRNILLCVIHTTLKQRIGCLRKDPYPVAIIADRTILIKRNGCARCTARDKESVVNVVRKLCVSALGDGLPLIQVTFVTLKI